MITVSMPYYETPDTVRKAVQSVLNQTYKDIRLVVVNDGCDPQTAWRPLADLADSRLVRFDLPENRGRYFADAVTLAACDSEWWTPHDSDDWSDLDRYAMMETKGRNADVVFCGYKIHRAKGKTVASVSPKVSRVVGAKELCHVAHHTAIYRPRKIREHGIGPNPTWRIAWDTLMVALAANLLRWDVVPEPLYHYQQRLGSLALGPTTGMTSPQRKAIHAKRTAMWRDFMTTGVVPKADDPAVLDEVAEHAGRLRDVLSEERAA